MVVKLRASERQRDRSEGQVGDTEDAKHALACMCVRAASTGAATTIRGICGLPTRRTDKETELHGSDACVVTSWLTQMPPPGHWQAARGCHHPALAPLQLGVDARGGAHCVEQAVRAAMAEDPLRIAAGLK
jgi:hypothetical protein